VVGVLGVLEDVRTAVPSGWREAGLSVVLLGATLDELDGSAWADVRHQHLGGVPPRVDLAAEKALANVLVAARRAGLAVAAHDLSEGGLMQTLLEGSLRYGVGFTGSLNGLMERDALTPFAALFSETTARALVAVRPEHEARLLNLATTAGIPALVIGITGGDAVVIDDVRISLAEARAAHEATLPGLYG